MEPKRECSLAVTQILHLHLYKNRLSGEPLWLPHPLFLFFPLLSLTLSLSLLLSFHVCCGFGRCHFRHVFRAPRTLCVLIVGHPWGRGGRTMRRTCLRAAVPGSVVRLSMELQTPGLPEGQEEGRLGFVSPFLLLPSLRFLFDLSPSLTFTLPLFFLSPLSWSSR